ncbi:MAG: LysR family transcriptional regulator [Gracilibacteraceae bacterium]|nr:LysR family transcriptional regulator [Gracilibacteraceae bacterium]
MRTEQIGYLSEIAKSKSLSIASKNLNLSVQALSSSMRRLEEEIGGKLLITTYKGTTLSKKGENLLKAGLVFLEEIKSLSAANHAPLYIDQDYQIYCVYGAIEILIPGLTVEFNKRYLNGALTPIQLPIETILSEIASGTTDFALVFRAHAKGHTFDGWDERFEFTPLKRLRLYCTANSNIAFYRQKSVSMKSLLKYDIIAFSPHAHHNSLDNLIKSYDRSKNVKYYMHRSVYRACLANSECVSLESSIDGLFYESLPNVSYIQISDEDIWIEIGYLKLKTMEITEKSSNLLDMIELFV